MTEALASSVGGFLTATGGGPPVAAGDPPESSLQQGLLSGPLRGGSCSKGALMLDNVDLSSKPAAIKKASRGGGPAGSPSPTIHEKVRSLFSGGPPLRRGEEEMETDECVSSSSKKSGVFSGVRTLKAIRKKKLRGLSKLGGSGIAKGEARAAAHPSKPRAPNKEEVKRGLASPKTVPSRLKAIVRRVNKRLSKRA
ncbi:hypothetical protein Efla_004821 [Eimeria flavescens]